MITRYTRPELGALWTDQAKMDAWRDVEVAAAEALDGPTDADLEAIRGATFTVEGVQEREAVTDHDMAAFVDVLAASAGPAGRWIHFGLTSSDVLDTALALQLRRAGAPLLAGARAYAAALAEQARAHAGTLCVGRTHGVHAEPTSFGLKLAGFALEAHRNAGRLERAFDQVATGAISGAVGHRWPVYRQIGQDFHHFRRLPPQADRPLRVPPQSGRTLRKAERRRSCLCRRLHRAHESRRDRCRDHRA
jgi:adenylosuccinate lyase